MNAEEQQAFEDEIYAFVGREVCPPTPAADDVNQAMIRHWAEAIGETNPAYTNAGWAADSRRGHTIAPPAMMYVWGQEGFQVTLGRSPDAQSELVETFNKHGYTGVLGTNVKQEYCKEVRPGDNVTMQMVIDNISERKTTARGTGYFFETLATFTDQNGDKVGTQRFKVLKFIPQDQPAAAASEDKLEVPTRIASPRGHDNKWWWDACDEGKLLIQRCKNCGTLRHPPRPMCGVCQSTEWDSIESSLKGEIMSYTCLRHPVIPGYPKDPICAVIKLEEGTHFVANVVGCEYEDVSIGARVQGKLEQVDEKTRLPQFYLVEGGAA
ncbi:MAG: MaoC family dehydratase N-terminal domain-containing protein [Pseudomonadota bacterium]